MKKTTNQKQAEFIALMDENGFTPNGETTYDGRPVYSRIWNKETEVVWYGTMESSLEIKVTEHDAFPLISIFKNGRPDGRRDYSSPKRAINAMREIVTFAGYSF
jgi:hypothetical protein